MARITSNATNYGEAVALIPMLKEAKNYEFWSLKMKTMFKSQELWDLVDKEFADNQTDNPDQPLRENRRKDAKALFLIQQSLDDEIFPLIAPATSSKQAWDILKHKYLDNKKVTRKEDEKNEIEEETSIDMVDSEARNEKKEVSREQAVMEEKAENDDKKAFENAALVVSALIITLSYEALLNPPSTLFKHGTHIYWECFFALGDKNQQPRDLINKLKNCPSRSALMFLIFNTAIFFQSIFILIRTFGRGYRGFLLGGLALYLTVCYCILLMISPISAHMLLFH